MDPEFKIIDFLKQQFPQQIGDDAAVFPYSATQSYLITQDILVEGRHFRLRYQTPESLAAKALQVNLSDVAAMGGMPRFVLLGLSIPMVLLSDPWADFIPRFLSAFSQSCKASSLILMGGDTTASSEGLFVSVTVIAVAATATICYRRAASPGEVLAVAGDLGWAHLGFIALERNVAGLDDFKNAFLNPQARLQEGAWLAAQPAVGAMMDLSDGLYIDLKRLCEAARCFAEIDIDQMAVPTALQAACRVLGLNPTEVSLVGGEDYGLLFSVDAQAYGDLNAHFLQTFGYPLHTIGRMIASDPSQPDDPVRLIQQGSVVDLSQITGKSFSHFAARG